MQMKTKGSVTIPEPLARALQASGKLFLAWEKLRPSCQRDYATLVRDAKDELSEKKRVDRVIALTKAYAARHSARKYREK